MKFTFKTIKPTGRHSWSYPDIHYIKLKGKQCGMISDKEPFSIQLMVVKSDIIKDKNPNCVWKHITLKKKSKTLEEAKGFLNKFCNEILNKYDIYCIDN